MAEIVSLAEAVERAIADGDTVAMEGFTHLIPFAAGHEVIRQRRRDLTLIRMTPDLIYDQLIGAGCASKLIFSWGGNPGVGSLHRFRDAVEHAWPVPLETRGAQPRRDGQPLRGRRVRAAVRRPARLQRHGPGDAQRRPRYDADDQADHLPVHRREADRRVGPAARRGGHPRPARRPVGQRPAVGDHRRAEGGRAGLPALRGHGGGDRRRARPAAGSGGAARLDGQLRGAGARRGASFLRARLLGPGQRLLRRLGRHRA